MMVPLRGSTSRRVFFVNNRKCCSKKERSATTRAHLAVIGPLGEALQCLRADVARGHIDDAHERGVIARVAHTAQVRHLLPAQPRYLGLHPLKNRLM